MPTEKPNFILIISDQHRGDCLGIEGHPVLLTPTLDHLAASGGSFAHAYSTCPVCIPARRSLLSGQFPSTHGMVGMEDNIPWYPPATLPGELRKAGYQTVLVGRDMHQSPRRKRFGFDQMVHTGDVHPDDVTGPLPGHGENPSWSHGLDANGWTARPWHLADDLHPSYRTVDAALHFLSRRDPECPFFLVVSFAAPHPPLYPPAFYFDRYLRTGVPKPLLGTWETAPAHGGLGAAPDSHAVNLQGEALLSCRAGYYGLINHIDDQIHRLLNPHGELDDKTRSNTVILYTSDHGEMLGDHHLFRKSAPYEGASRIPLILQAPPSFGFPRGARLETPACLEDVMPTILALAGVPCPESVDGRNLVPDLSGSLPESSPRILHLEMAREPGQSWHALTNGQRKYIWRPSDGREQFFDLASDPGELTDLSGKAEYQEPLRRFREHLIGELGQRCEGFVVEGRLKPGAAVRKTLPHVSARMS
ncbi:MAG: sulfatase-like hydrolase/transferase [Spirochaetes bacterium]|nr:sulfatase-like hydrolase/transferase [Spirochaetota bacterium]